MNVTRVKPVAVLLLLWLLCYQAVAVGRVLPFDSGNHSGPEAASACHEMDSPAVLNNGSVVTDRSASEDPPNTRHHTHNINTHNIDKGHHEAASDCCHLGCGCCVMGCHSLASLVLPRLLIPGSLPLLSKESSAVPEGPANTPYRPPILT